MRPGEDRPLRVAVVGLGWVGTHRHLPWLRRAPGVEVAGGIDHSAARVEEAGPRFRLPRASAADGPEGVPWLDQVDAVTIATPPATHHPLARSYLEAGKHVLVEKPLAMDPVQARDLAQTAARTGRILAVVHNFQFARSTSRMLSLLGSGDLGELRAIDGLQLSNPSRRLPAWYESLPLGLFTDESPHLLYLARRLLGPTTILTHSELVPSRTGGRTPALASLHLEGGGVHASLAMHFEAPVSEWHLAVIGSERIAVVDLFRDVLVLVGNDGRHAAPDILRSSLEAVRSHLLGVLASGLRLGTGRLAYGNDTVIERFAGSCRSGLQPEGISAADGVGVVELQHQVQARSAFRAA